MKPVVITAGWLVVAADQSPRPGWELRVDGGKVDALGPAGTLARPGDQVVDATRAVVMPGFINTHHHMYGMLSHGIPVRVPPSGFSSFLEDFWWPQVEDRLTRELLRAAAGLAAVEMIRSGVTTFSDILEAPYSLPGALAAQAEVIEGAGLRGILSFEATERAGPEVAEAALRENYDFARAAGSGQVRGMMCVHTTFTCSVPYLRRARRLAHELGSGIQLHLSESAYEPRVCRERYGLEPVELYDSIGFLDSGVLASQCVKLTDRELDILAARGVRASHMPLSNCEVGGGIAPVPELLARGVAVGLGTDGYINNFFEVMRGAFLIHKARLEDPQVMPARTVFDLATRGGARALARPELGRLTPGSPADLVVVDGNLPTPITGTNLFDQLVLFRNPADVLSVMVDGRFLMQDGRLLTIDEAGARAALVSAARAFWGLDHD
ncbi:MAG: amidohydrolase [Bacillota bacterium]